MERVSVKIIGRNFWEDQKTKPEHINHIRGTAMNPPAIIRRINSRQARANTDDGIAAQRADQPQWRLNFLLHESDLEVMEQEYLAQSSTV